jgi:hypothetical protein
VRAAATRTDNPPVFSDDRDHARTVSGHREAILAEAIASLRFTSRYAVPPDADRFLVIAPLETDLSNREMPITVVLDWPMLRQDE